ncbi:hypothetical protein HYU19_04065 [Candidatus Woesearchaeota archaeon]|nr:hypothetical protein [Candidatus Woesearchaeota archaeon]
MAVKRKRGRRQRANGIRPVCFVLLVPVYWLAIFKYVMAWFDLNVFFAVVLSSYALSLLGFDWGMLSLQGKKKKKEDGRAAAGVRSSAPVPAVSDS